MRVEENFKSGVEKYKQCVCATRPSGNLSIRPGLSSPSSVCFFCVVSQTPGELRARSGRLHTFADNAAVVDALAGLIEREGDPLVVKLPRTPGRKDAEYMHLFSGPIDVEAHASQAQAVMAAGTPERISVSELAQRVSRLEAEVAELKEQLKTSL